MEVKIGLYAFIFLHLDIHRLELLNLRLESPIQLYILDSVVFTRASWGKI